VTVRQGTRKSAGQEDVRVLSRKRGSGNEPAARGKRLQTLSRGTQDGQERGRIRQGQVLCRAWKRKRSEVENGDPGPEQRGPARRKELQEVRIRVRSPQISTRPRRKAKQLEPRDLCHADGLQWENRDPSKASETKGHHLPRLTWWGLMLQQMKEDALKVVS